MASAYTGKRDIKSRDRDKAKSTITFIENTDFTVESGTKEDAAVPAPTRILALTSNGSSNRGIETGVHLRCGSKGVPKLCDENAGCYHRNTGTNTTP